ncbi:MAG: Rpn family recombination-promoting nuclease/putative transposase [Hespellia sp.]|nr:Rpn family recombination-promoting nuclease/putative transposase [Hespellia sp.]
MEEQNKPITLLKDLKLTDRFLFDETMEDPEAHQAVLSIIMRNAVNLLPENEVEKQLQTLPYLKSVRLDVFAMDAEENVYNTEMQKSRKSDLQKRSRFYQSLIDSSLLPPGSISYNLLNDSYIIMITPFDLFGYGKYQYTFQARCKEVPELHLADGATRIFLNTKGKNADQVSEELIHFLKYVENTDDKTAEESNSELIKTIHECVKRVKASEEAGVKYMQAWEEKVYEREEGREEGESIRVIKLIMAKVTKNLDEKTIAEHLEESEEFVGLVCRMIRENPTSDAKEIWRKCNNESNKLPDVPVPVNV